MCFLLVLTALLLAVFENYAFYPPLPLPESHLFPVIAACASGIAGALLLPVLLLLLDFSLRAQG